MYTNFSKSLTQVNEVLKYTDVNLTQKIPNSFKNYIVTNMSKNYKFIISDEDTASTIMENLTDEAKAILGIIYRNYICSSNEKEYLLHLEKKYINFKEIKKIQKKVKTNDIFQNNETTSLANSNIKFQQTEKNLIQFKEKWYIVLLEKLLKKLKG